MSEELETSEEFEKLDQQIKAEADKLGLLKEEKEGVKEGNKEEDPYLEEAIKQGYKPDYNGPNKKTPQEFVKDGSFFRKIEAQNKKIDELIEFNKQAMEHAAKVEKAAYEQAIKDLQLKKLEAIQEADVDKVLVVEQEIRARESLNPQPTTKPTEVGNTPEELEFRERNSDWIKGESKEDAEMRASAGATIYYLQQTNPNIAPKDAIAIIESNLKRDFPSKFKNENQDNPPLNTSSTVSTSESRKGSLSERMSKQQRDFFRSAQKYGSKITLEEYAKQLDLVGELRND